MHWLVANTAAAALLGVLVLAIGRWLRPAPAVMHVLWWFVVLKLITPPLFAVPLLPASAAPTHIAGFELPIAPLPQSPDPESIVAGLDELPSITAPISAAPAAEPWTLPQFLLLLWAATAAHWLLLAAWGTWRNERRLRALAPVPSPLRREVERLAADLGVATPELRDDPAAGSPYVWGLLRPRLLLPVRTLQRANARGRAAVLAHELAHLRRRDHWLAHLEVLLAAALWWHPLFWFARRQCRLWAELAADAWAVRSVPDATIDYAAVLVEAAAANSHAVPAPAVLAVRPNARSAFETRLTMLLHENVARRSSRAWWLSFAGLSLALFAVPVAAQRPRQDPAPVEIRVNGKAVDELNASERKALLRALLAAEEKAAPEAEPEAEPEAVTEAPRERPARPSRNRTARVRDLEPAEAPAPARNRAQDPARGDAQSWREEVQRELRTALAEVRNDLANDPDLRELGIDDEVSKLVEGLAAGRGIEAALPDLIAAATKGVMPVIEKELRADPDLRELGLTDAVLDLVRGFVGNERNQELIGTMVEKFAFKALDEARAEIRSDPELRKLGLTGDVEKLVDTVIKGGDFDAQLQKIIDQAMRAAGQHGRQESVEEPTEEPPARPQPRRNRIR